MPGKPPADATKRMPDNVSGDEPRMRPSRSVNAVSDTPEERISRYARSAYSGRKSDGGPESFQGGVRSSAELARERKEEQREQARAEKHAGVANGRKRRHPVRNTIIVLLVCIVAVFAYWFHVIDENMHIDDADLADATTGTATPWSPYYLLITGNDSREGETARTDTIMLCRVDPVKKQLSLVSIPRDTRVSIDGYGKAKINAAYAYGGPALTTTTVSEFADDTPIAHYYEVGFEGFVSLVDAVGGVTVDVPENTEVYGESIPSGVQTLNGEQALIFVRCRDTYKLGDFQRQANQRQFMSALLKSIKQAPIWKWPSIITAISKCVGTDAWAWQSFLITLEVAGTSSDNIYSAQVPSTAKTIDGVSYVITDDDAWSTMLARLRAGEDPNS
jgi:LCP family protein required for cell wall assembly